MNDEIMQTYGFSYMDCDGKVYEKVIHNPDATWHSCIDDYVKFLESVFCYDIKSQVRLEEPKYLKQVHITYHDYLDPWTGEYFVKDDEE